MPTEILRNHLRLANIVLVLCANGAEGGTYLVYVELSNLIPFPGVPNLLRAWTCGSESDRGVLREGKRVANGLGKQIATKLGRGLVQLHGMGSFGWRGCQIYALASFTVASANASVISS